MRRRPMEFWWIAAFGLFTAFSAVRSFDPAATWTSLPSFDIFNSDISPVILGYCAALVLAPILLMSFLKAGRWACTVVLGIEAVYHARHFTVGFLPSQGVPPQHGVVLLFCMWMIFYLQRPSTERLFRTGAQAHPIRASGLGLNAMDVLEVVGAVLFAKGLHLLGLDPWYAGFSGLVAYILYGVFLEDRCRHRWAAFFSRADADFPAADLPNYRAACHAFSKRDYQGATTQMATATADARQRPAGRLLLRMVEWHNLIDLRKMDGKACLRRLIYDHDWKPTEGERRLLADAVENSSCDGVRALVDERAELLEMLVQAGVTANSFFYSRSDRILTRITGEAFAFNTHESWAAWWDDNREQWTGDAGTISVVARLIHRDASLAAHLMAAACAGRAEEPILKDLTAQVVFLNAMQKAIREHQSVEAFIKQPQRMLLVPEITDAVGLLHADSQLLENLGMQMPQVIRRLQLRVPLVDYIGKLWERYPNELNADMPWLLQTLTNKNLGILRARSRFERWWPDARGSFLRHDKAVIVGITAMSDGDEAKAEKAFRAALAEQPRELSSRYNLVLCVMRRHDHGEAVQLLKELTELEPKEPYWWIVLGDIHRTINKSTDAFAAFKKALELGAAEGRVALHMGLTFARDKRDNEAIKQLDRALGKNPSTSKIEALVSALESEGFWTLAGHYRELAFRRGLHNPDDDDGEMPRGDEDAVA